MDYLKYNCYDLTTQNNELMSIEVKLQDLYSELAGVFTSLDSYLKKYDNLQKLISEFSAELSKIINQIYCTCKALEQIIDVYYAAECNVLRLNEELPTVLNVTNKKSTNASINSLDYLKVSAASINRSDLILEDWLAELIYKS